MSECEIEEYYFSVADLRAPAPVTASPASLATSSSYDSLEIIPDTGSS